MSLARHRLSRRLPLLSTNIYDQTTAMPGAQTTLALTANRLYAVPIFLEESAMITDLAILVSTNAAGSARLGAFDLLATGLPGAKLLDAGEVSVATNGYKPITGLTLARPAGLSWLCVVSDVTATVHSINPYSTLLGGDGASTYGYYYVAHVYGALPSTFGSPIGGANSGPRIWFKVA